MKRLLLIGCLVVSGCVGKYGGQDITEEEQISFSKVIDYSNVTLLQLQQEYASKTAKEQREIEKYKKNFIISHGYDPAKVDLCPVGAKWVFVDKKTGERLTK